MKYLILTEEMKKYQRIARNTYEQNKVVDVGAVVIGWKLQKGSVLVDTVKGFEFEITGDLPAAEGIVSVKVTANGSTQDKHARKSDIARIILSQSIEVYYSK